jgi:Cu/Ag efflux pump CusA
MVLAGFVIAIGAVVDDAIVDTENIVRRLRQHRRGEMPPGTSTARVIFDASIEVRGAVVFASLIEILALVPVFFLQDLTGSFFRPLASSYALAVAVSMVVALVLTPALAMILLARAPLERRESPFARWVQHGYERLLGRIVRTPRPAYGAVALLMVLGAVLAPRLGQSLFPQFKERDFLMHWVTKPGTSHPEEVRIVQRASRELRAIPGVRNFGSHIGQAFLADEVVGVNFGENWISIDKSADYDKTVHAIERVVAGYPGLFRNVETYLNERIQEVLTGSSNAIVVRIFGDDLVVLRQEANKTQELLAGIKGVVGAHVELQESVPQVEVQVDLEAARRAGIKPGDVRRAAATMVAGEEVGDIFRAGKAYDVFVWSIPSARDSVNDIRELRVDTPQGGTVRLGDVASVNIRPTPNVISREGASRVIDVGANVKGRSLGSVVHDIDDHIEEVHLPLRYHAEVLGEFEARKSADRRLAVLGMFSAVGILLLLFTSFGSMRLALLSYVTLPTALVGGVIAAYVSGGNLSLGSLVGFFTVLGLVARNGIMQVSHYQHLEHFEGETFGPGLVLRGSRERIVPILMTASATGLALIPLLLTGAAPGQEIEYPMAIVILGGLITATIINLFVVPSLYLRLGKRRSERTPPTNPA